MSTWTPPMEFDDYRLLEPLGAGAMGQVYLAEDTVLARRVAIKFLAGDADPEARQRLIIEARAAARIQHPNVVSVFRVGELGEQPYLISEFVRGTALSALPLPLPWPRVLEIGVDLARGLGAAHRSGVLHRDVKPANAMVDEEGRAKLLDFGLAALVAQDGAERSTERAPALVGTPDYLAPELWSGGTPSRRSDVYALGAVLFELLVGHAPLAQVAEEALLAAGRSAPRPRLGALVPAADRALAELVDRCLALDPARRPESGEALRDELEALARRAAAPPIPPGNPYRGLRPFELEHRALFFGREVEVGALLDRLRAEPALLVAGEAGAGKSSLIRAGLAPAVLAGGLQDGRRWRVLELFPGARPALRLAEALSDGPGEAAEALAALIRRDTAAALTELKRLVGAPEEGTLLFVDQLEELVLLAEPEEAAAAERFLGAVLRTHAPGLRLVASVRVDLLPRLAARPDLSQDLSRVLWLLPPMSGAGMRAAIEEPARVAGHRFESARMVEDLLLAIGPGELGVLELALARLWSERDADGTLTEASLTAMGGAQGALAAYADAVFDALPADQRDAARRALPRLVSSAGARLARTEVELGGGQALARCLDALVAARIVVREEREAGASFRLAQEQLGRAWPRLGGWLLEDAEERIQRERLARAAEEWSRLERSPELLYRRRQLAELDPVELGPLPELARAFLAASRRARLLGRLKAAALVLGVLGSVAVPLGLSERSRRARVEQEVQAHLGPALERMSAGAALAEAARTRRARLFLLFDQGEAASAEVLWAEVLAAESAADEAWSKAGAGLEAALSRDPLRVEVRAHLSEALLARAVLAERRERRELLEDLSRRLSAHDPAAASRFTQAASLTVHTASVAARLWATRHDAAGRPQLELELGVTPVRGRALAPGSYVLRAVAPGRAPVSLALVLGRGAVEQVRLELPRAEHVPPGFVHVPPSALSYGTTMDEASRRGFFDTVPHHRVQGGGFLIGVHEVQIADWIEFLEALPPAERARRLPSAGGRLGGGGALRLEERGGWHLYYRPGAREYLVGPGQQLVYAGRAQHAAHDWRRLPVTGVSADDAQAYVAWLDASGRVPGARLCTEREWEGAARGADGREFPHGAALEPEDANFDIAHGRDELGLEEVGAHPAGASPFGLQDMAGNAFELTRAVVGEGFVARGGSYLHDRKTCQSTNRAPTPRDFRDVTLGLRVCADPGAGRRHASR